LGLCVRALERAKFKAPFERKKFSLGS